MAAVSLFSLFSFFILISIINCIELSISPTLQKSSLSNQLNCLSYKTTSNIQYLKFKKLNDLRSQELNLRILDNDENLIRGIKKIDSEIDLFFSIPSSSDKFWVCFDNIIKDKSWSFRPEAFQIELSIDLDILNFNKDSNDNQVIITHEEFANIDELLTQVTSINDQMNEFKTSFNNLINIESNLRDLNESIYKNFTFFTIYLFVLIFSLSVLQMVYFKYYLNFKKII